MWMTNANEEKRGILSEYIPIDKNHFHHGTAVVVQWLRILLTQGTQV